MERINKLRQKFDEYKISGMIFKDVASVRWFSGCNAHGNAIMVICQNDVYFITDGRYAEQAKNEVKDAQVLVTESGSYFEEIVKAGIIKKRQRIGFEAWEFPYSDFQFLKKLLTWVRFIPLPNIVETLASIKEPKEIALIRKVVRLTDHILEKHILPKIKVGASENDLAAEVLYQGRKHGLETSFDPIVLSGFRSSLIHGEPSAKIVAVGDILQFDIGFKHEGYCSDLSRVVFIGKEPDKTQREVYATVLDSQNKAIATVEPGVKCSDLDKIARDFIKEKVSAENWQVDDMELGFGHSLGHGVGIWIHTLPRISNLINSLEVVEAGNVFTVEPGIYIPGWGGMRLEDVVLVTKDGYENLTKSSKDIKVLG